MATEVRIDEVHSTFDTVNPEALLTHDVIARIAAAVRACERAERHRNEDRDADLDTRSVVEQQRPGRR